MSYSRRKVMKALADRGFVVIREGKRHTIVRSESSTEIVIPRHKELKRGTVRGIAQDADIDWEDLRGEIS